MPRKTFHEGCRVLVKLTPGSPIEHEATYLGVYTIHWGQRPWHRVQINADKHIVPIGRIRARAQGGS